MLELVMDGKGRSERLKEVIATLEKEEDMEAEANAVARG
jgi:hypothetical protein